MKKKIIYFYDSSRKDFSVESVKEAAHNLRAVTRDLQAVSEGEKPEICDGVAGFAPQSYLDVYPRVDGDQDDDSAAKALAKAEKAAAKAAAKAAKEAEELAEKSAAETQE